jgi:signal transduction histidine kinase
VELTLFDTEGNEVSHETYSLDQPARSTNHSRITPTFHLEPQQSQIYTVVARVRGLEPIGLDVSLEEQDASDHFEARLNLFLALYMGVLSALIVYNLFIYRTLKERFFLYYTGLGASLLILVPTLNGLPDYLMRLPGTFSDWIAFTTATACLCGNQFSREFLSLNIHFPRLDRIQKGLAWISAAAAIQSLPPIYRAFPEWVGPCNVLLLVSTVLLIIACAIVASRHSVNQRSARLFLFAFGTFVISCAAFIGVTQGLLPNNPLTRSIVEIFNILEMLLLSFAMSDKVRALEEDRVGALQKAWHADRLEHLFKMVCHDIANPLYVVLTHAQFAAKGRPVNWDAVLRAVNQQQDILNFARKQGITQYIPEVGVIPETDIRDTIATLRFLFERVAADKGVEVIFPVLSSQQDVHVLAEPIALAHGVLANAISNAIKFSSQGQKVRLEFEDDGDEVTLSVIDEGTGIAPEVRRELEIRGRADSRPGVRGELGTGYGFQLMHFFMQTFGGSIEWQSFALEDGKGETGTRFDFRLKKT